MTPNPTLSAFDAIYNRRSTRAFTPERIGEPIVRELLRAAIHAPTAMHLEPWAFAIVQDRALMTRISDRAKTRGTTAFGTEHRELARNPETSRLPAIFTDPRFDIFYGATTLIVICAKPIGSFATADCWLAAESLMLAATALGLATCPIGFALLGLLDPEIRTALAIPDGVTPVAPIIVGVPSSDPPPSTRRDPEILCWRSAA